MITELDIIIMSVNGLTYWDLESMLKEELDKGTSLIEVEIFELQPDEAKNLIKELKKEFKDCQRQINTDKTEFEEYPYFSKAYFDDKNGNLIYIDKMKEAPFFKVPIYTYSFKLEGAPIEKVDQRLLHIKTGPYAKLFVSILELLKDRLDDFNISLHSVSMNSEEESSKYALSIGKNHSSKELTYLFNLLSRIHFFDIRDGDYEKLYRLIADLYKSQRGLKANKAKTVKNDWTNSAGHKIDESFLKNFKEKVLKELTVLVQEDIARGYDPKRRAKFN
jgi:hypothetical protein